MEGIPSIGPQFGLTNRCFARYNLRKLGSTVVSSHPPPLRQFFAEHRRTIDPVPLSIPQSFDALRASIDNKHQQRWTGHAIFRIFSGTEIRMIQQLNSKPFMSIPIYRNVMAVL